MFVINFMQKYVHVTTTISNETIDLNGHYYVSETHEIFIWNIVLISHCYNFCGNMKLDLHVPVPMYGNSILKTRCL